MIQYAPKAELFKQQLNNSLKLETKNFRTVRIAKNENVYTCGDKSDCVYFIESGQIKLLMLSSDGKECILAIYSTGDVFGELCLSHLDERHETAIAMKETRLKEIPCSKFFLRLAADSLLEGFIRYLSVRISDQQEMIKNLVTVDSEHRLGETLLRLARKTGTKEPRSIKFTYKITHEELSEMVGTTRPRISKFMRRFLMLDLIEISPERLIIVKEKRLTEYLNNSVHQKKPLSKNICKVV
jgi:CRP-like cAMP-binding protein